MNQKIFFAGQQSAKIENTLNEVGIKINVLVVSLRYAEPYVFGSFGFMRYTNDIRQAEWSRKVSALSFGTGAGLKFNISSKIILKSELGLHFIPGKNVLNDIAFTVGDIVFKTSPLTSLNIGVAYKIAD
jgi:opacity protein-like surface antigen